MTQCQYPGCTNQVQKPKRGPVRLYCNGHKSEWQRELKRCRDRKYREANGSSESREEYGEAVADTWIGMAYIRQVEAELGIHQPTEICRRCGKKLLPVHKRMLMSYCCRECYMAMFRSSYVSVGGN